MRGASHLPASHPPPPTSHPPASRLPPPTLRLPPPGFLLMDVARYKYPGAWVRAAQLFAAMNSTDSTSSRCAAHRARGHPSTPLTQACPSCSTPCACLRASRAARAAELGRASPSLSHTHICTRSRGWVELAPFAGADPAPGAVAGPRLRHVEGAAVVPCVAALAPTDALGVMARTANLDLARTRIPRPNQQPQPRP